MSWPYWILLCVPAVAALLGWLIGALRYYNEEGRYRDSRL